MKAASVYETEILSATQEADVSHTKWKFNAERIRTPIDILDHSPVRGDVNQDKKGGS